MARNANDLSHLQDEVRGPKRPPASPHETPHFQTSAKFAPTDTSPARRVVPSWISSNTLALVLLVAFAAYHFAYVAPLQRTLEQLATEHNKLVTDHNKLLSVVNFNADVANRNNGLGR